MTLMTMMTTLLMCRGVGASLRLHWDITGTVLEYYWAAPEMLLSRTWNITEAQGKTRRFLAFDSITFGPRLSNIPGMSQKHSEYGSKTFRARFSDIPALSQGDDNRHSGAGRHTDHFPIGQWWDKHKLYKFIISGKVKLLKWFFGSHAKPCVCSMFRPQKMEDIDPT